MILNGNGVIIGYDVNVCPFVSPVCLCLANAQSDFSLCLNCILFCYE